MEKEQIEKVINEIFDPFLLGDEMPAHILNSPVTYQQITEFAALIIQDKSEESFQQYLAQNPNFLFRLAPSTDDTNLGFIAKPPISNFNTADFGIFSVSQGGARIFLVEIERPSDQLFTQKLTPAQKLQIAIGQVQDWDQWIRANRQTFINTCFKILRASPKYPDKSHNGTFIYTDADNIEATWNAFGGSEYCNIEYLIVIGRWSHLSKEQKDRFMYLNTQYHNLNLRIRTYDNLVRKAIEGPKFFW
jgi:hypothetical protein